MASSATKIKTKLPEIPGTKPSMKNAQLLISTGIPFLDNIIGLFTNVFNLFHTRCVIIIFLKSLMYLYVLGGGLPIGSLFIIGMYII